MFGFRTIEGAASNGVVICCSQNSSLPTRTNVVYSNPYNLNLFLSSPISIRYKSRIKFWPNILEEYSTKQFNLNLFYDGASAYR